MSDAFLIEHIQLNMKFLLLLIVSLVALAAVQGVDTCQDDKKDIGDCKIKYHVCDHWQGSSLKYQAEAKDEASGSSEKGDWHSSSDHAAQEATQLLFSKDLKCHGYNNFDCNCQSQDVDQATCHLSVVVCFYFKNDDDVKDKKLTYRGYAFDKEATDHEGKSDGFSDQTECGNAAAMDLFSKYADTGAKCGYGQEGVVGAPAAVNTTSINFKPVM